MANILEAIDADLKTAMKDKNAAALDTLRMLKTAAKMKQIDLMRPIEDEEVQAVIRTYIKQQEEAQENFTKGGRTDLAAKADAEIILAKKYLPAQMSEAEVKAIVEKKVTELKATSADYGKVMGAVMKEVSGKADGGLVGKVVKEVLAK